MKFIDLQLFISETETNKTNCSCLTYSRGSPLTQLAILHPRSFAVYSFATKQGTTEQGRLDNGFM